MLNEGNKYQGEYGKQGRLLDGRAPTVGAFRRRQEQLAGSSQIFPEFVLVQPVYFVFHHIRFFIT
jgi:hypothetical protein